MTYEIIFDDAKARRYKPAGGFETQVLGEVWLLRDDANEIGHFKEYDDALAKARDMKLRPTIDQAEREDGQRRVARKHYETWRRAREEIGL